MNRSLIVRSALLLGVGCATVAAQANYVQIFSLPQVNPEGIATPFLDTVTVSGGTAYATVRNNATGANGTLTSFSGGVFTQLMTQAQWAAGAAAATPAITTDPAGTAGAAIAGGSWRGVSSLSSVVTEINLGTGAASVVIPKATFDAAVGGTATLGAQNEVLPSGQIYVYNSPTATRRILSVDPSNVVTTEVSAANLNSIFGVATTPTINGLGILGTTLYLGSNSTDSIVSWDTVADTGATVLTTGDITAVIGGTTAGFGDIYAAPDGLIYFVETVSSRILRFDPSSPASSLATYLSSAQLLAGPAVSNNVGQLAWFNGGLAWTQSASASGQVPGFYGIPEPSTAVLALLAVCRLAVRRR